MNIIVLMGGSSQAFHESGSSFPKNLVEIAGLPLVQRVLENLAPLLSNGNQLICLLSKEEQREFHTSDVIQLLVPNAICIESEGQTSGAACTALLASDYTDNDKELLIVNGDQIIETDLLAVIQDFKSRELDAGTIVFDGVHPRWSFVRLNSEGFVVEAAEKRPLSRNATAGFYYFKRGRDFVKGAFSMICKNNHVDGRFYVCPVFNELILASKRLGVHEIDRESYRSLATPANVASYEEQLREAKQ